MLSEGNVLPHEESVPNYKEGVLSGEEAVLPDEVLGYFMRDSVLSDEENVLPGKEAGLSDEKVCYLMRCWATW